jgi:hypothetical protein
VDKIYGAQAATTEQASHPEQPRPPAQRISGRGDI